MGPGDETTLARVIPVRKPVLEKLSEAPQVAEPGSEPAALDASALQQTPTRLAPQGSAPAQALGAGRTRKARIGANTADFALDSKEAGWVFHCH